jgi:hypothetical protein
MATKRKTVKKPTHFERLRNAGVLEAKHFTDEEKKVINRLSRSEVDMLIRMRRKRGPAPKGREEVRPNFCL